MEYFSVDCGRDLSVQVVNDYECTGNILHVSVVTNNFNSGMKLVNIIYE